MESANLATVRLDPLTHGVYSRISALASAWDTLGWILFLRGDVASSEKYMTPAWIILRHPAVGDHLAELYEKQGKKDESLTYSGLTVAALKTMKQPQESDIEAGANARARIDRLEPGAMKRVLQQTAQLYTDANSIAIPNPGRQTGRGRFCHIAKPRTIRRRKLPPDGRRHDLAILCARGSQADATSCCPGSNPTVDALRDGQLWIAHRRAILAR